MGDSLADKCGESIGIDVRNYARDNIPLATNGADDWRFARANAARPAATAAFVPMPVFGQAANKSFINLRQFRRAYQCPA